MDRSRKSSTRSRKSSTRTRKSVAKKSSTRTRKSVAKKSSTRARKSVAKKSSTRERKSVDKKSSTRARKSVVKKSLDVDKKLSKSVIKNPVIKKRPVIIEEETKKSVKVVSKKEDVIFGKGGISAISGPVSFYYLRPKKDVYKQGNGQYFPLIVLFGDYHSSLANTCKPCALNKGCYKLSDPRFLRKLDTLSSPQHPVDFYTETVLSGTGRGFKGGMLKDLTSGEMISCYHHRLRGTAYDKCPTKNIRWQAGETRMIWRGDLSYSYEEDHFMNNLYKNPSNVSKMEKHTWIEQEFSTILFQFEDLKKISQLEQFKNNKDKNGLNYMKQVYRDRINGILRNGVFKNIQGFQRLLLTLCDDSNGSKYINLEKFAETFFGMFTKDNSLIYKQIAKQGYPPFRSFQKWVDFYKKSLNYRAYSHIEFLMKNKEEHRILYYIEKEKIRKTIQNLAVILSVGLDFDFSNFDLDHYFVTHISAPLLDLYTIARIWKQPTEGIRSSLSFGYFGDAHVQNIVQLLVSTNMYELVYEKNASYLNYSRCQKFDVTLNLSEEVRSHNQKIE